MSYIYKLLKIVFFIVIVSVVCNELYKRFLNLDWDTLAINYPMLVYGIILDVCSRFFLGYMFKCLINIEQPQFQMKFALSISWISNIGKYIPGKGAIIISYIYLLAKQGIKSYLAIVTPLLCNLITFLICLLFSIPLFYNFFITSRKLHFFLFILFFCIIIIIVIKKTHFLPSDIKCYAKKVLKGNKIFIFSIGFIQCICTGLSSWFVLQAICPLKSDFVLQTILLTFNVAVISFLSFFSPAGIGVKEGGYLIGLTSMTGETNAAIITLLIRAVNTMVDIILALIGYLIIIRSDLSAKKCVHK